MLKYNEFAYNQIQIIASPFVEKETISQAKRITLKRWMKGRNYHKRINKKLLKRHGVNISIPYVFSGSAYPLYLWVSTSFAFNITYIGG